MFKDIKVGDEVFVRMSVTYSYGNGKYFYIPIKVEKVSKTQFVADGRRFKKDYGKEIGGGYGQAVFFGGENRHGHIISDQTLEMTQFKATVNDWYEIRKLASDFSVSIDNENLYDIKSLLKKASKLSDA